MYGVNDSLGDLALVGELGLCARIDYDGRLGVEGRLNDEIAGGISASQSDDFFEVLRGKLPQLHRASGRDQVRRGARSNSTRCTTCGRASRKFDQRACSRGLREGLGVRSLHG